MSGASELEVVIFVTVAGVPIRAQRTYAQARTERLSATVRSCARVLERTASNAGDEPARSVTVLMVDATAGAVHAPAPFRLSRVSVLDV